jgi:uncharacterized protein YraI
MTTSTIISSSVSRRSMIKYALGATVAVALGGVTLVSSASARSGGSYRTTTALNLREQASTSSKVLAVIPAGETVGYLGDSSNGFLAVSYQGMSGWAYEDFLEPSIIGGDDPTTIGSAVVTSAVNFRVGPSTGHDVLDVLAAGTIVQIFDRVQNGFRFIVHDSQLGWVYDDFLGQDDGGSSDGPGVFYTTSAVNLRAQPSTSSNVLMVVPPDAQVLDYDFVMSNGFRGVDYNGNVGWIYDDFLAQ